ncbi:unnamed protein product [Adineta steineri]|uniref:Uncharacterized protein n=1 Tax=Adineta steineri TaxID=433720 RepID=A0A813MX21_9BILA|nr:unnamed protein product [Adineta steineri]CAF3647774.1 unnamed protein product [Adineta steineri]
MLRTLFTDLPDLVILNIIHYLSPFDAIQAFYNIDNDDDNRILNLLIEARCFSSIHQLRLPLFNFVCDYVIPYMGSKLSHLTLYDHQLMIARTKQIYLYLSNLSSLHLINIIEIEENDNDLSYFLNKQLKKLTIQFISEHHIEAQAYICEQFIFNKESTNLIDCHLLNNYGIHLRRLNLFPNNSIQEMTVQLKHLTDLHVLFDNLINIKILNIEICQWTIEDIKYDYTKLSKKLPHLIEFSLQTHHTLSFNQMISIIQHLIYLNKLSFIYRNYDERGIDINQLQLVLDHLHYLKHLHFIIKFIYFNLNPKLTFEYNIQLKQQWNVHTYMNSLYKTYLAYTQPVIHRNFSISSDILLDDDLIYLPTITNLNLNIHTKQISLLPIIRLLNSHFPCLNHLHVVDSFGIEEKNDCNIQLFNVHSLNASELKISNLFFNLIQSLPNLVYLQVNSNILINCDLKLLFVNNQIKHLELITKNFDEINNILLYFPILEYLIINNKKQSNDYKRKSYRIVFNWFEICTQLYTIHIKTDKLSNLFFNLSHTESNPKIHIQYSNEMLTVWK